MSLTVDGFWKAGFWNTGFWGNGFWLEGSTRSGGAGGLITFLAWRSPTEAGIEKAKLELKLRKEKATLQRIEKKIRVVEKKVAKQTVPDGVLANLGSLRERAAELRKNIEITAVDLIAVRDFLLSLNFDDDEEDVEILLMGL